MSIVKGVYTWARLETKLEFPLWSRNSEGLRKSNCNLPRNEVDNSVTPGFAEQAVTSSLDDFHHLRWNHVLTQCYSSYCSEHWKSFLDTWCHVSFPSPFWFLDHHNIYLFIFGWRAVNAIFRNWICKLWFLTVCSLNKSQSYAVIQFHCASPYYVHIHERVSCTINMCLLSSCIWICRAERQASSLKT